MESSSRKRFIYNAGKSKKSENKSSLQFDDGPGSKPVSNSSVVNRNDVGKERLLIKKDVSQSNTRNISTEDLALSYGKEPKRQKTDAANGVVDAYDDLDDFDFADDIQDELSLLELDRIELEASQLPSNSNQSTSKCTDSSNNPLITKGNLLSTGTKTKQFVFRKPSTPTSPNNSRIRSSCSSDASPNLKETLTLFSGTFNDQYDDEKLMRTNAVVDDSRLEASKEEVDNLKERLLSKDGEIKMLRDSLARLQSLDIQSKNVIHRLNDEIKENESKKNASLKVQIEKLETQLKFKEKEVSDAIHKQNILTDALNKKSNNQLDSKPNSVKSSPGDGFQKSPRKVSKPHSDEHTDLHQLNENESLHITRHEISKYEIIANQISAVSSQNELHRKIPCSLLLPELISDRPFIDKSNDKIDNVIRTCTCDMSILKEITTALHDTCLQLYHRSLHIVLKLCKTVLIGFWQKNFLDKAQSRKMENNHTLLIAIHALCILLKLDFNSRSLLLYEMMSEEEIDGCDDINDELLGVVSILQSKDSKLPCPTFVEILSRIICNVTCQPLVEIAFSCYCYISDSRRLPLSLFEHLSKENICSFALKTLGASAADGALTIFISSIENGKTLELLCNKKELCPLLQILRLCVGDGSANVTSMCDIKLKVVCLLSSIVAKHNGNYSILFNHDCDCSNELLRSLVLMLHKEYSYYEETLIDGIQTDIDNNRFRLLRQGTSLLAQLCLNDKNLIEHRHGVVQEYTILIHGVVRTLQQKPAISEHEILLLQDLMAIDQYDEIEDASQMAL